MADLKPPAGGPTIVDVDGVHGGDVRKSVAVPASSDRRKSSALVVTYLEEKDKVAAERKAKAEGKKVDSGNESKMPREVQMDEHRVPVEELVKRFNTDLEKGMTSDAAAAALAKYGPNKLKPPKKTPEIVIYLLGLVQGFMCILWVAGILSFIAYGITPTNQDNLYLGIVLMVVIFGTGTFGYYQELKARSTMEGFASLLPTFARAWRNGQLQEINCVDIVPGDLVEIQAGQKIPADVRILKCNLFKVDNSSMTGESEPQSRAPECTDDNPFETKNLAFFGTASTEGSATAMVVITGDNTLIGQIADLAQTDRGEMTPLAREMNRFVMIIAGIAGSLGILFFGLGFVRNIPAIESLVFAISVVVANVPEGIMVTSTIALTHAANVMASKFVLVKKLDSVETMGATSCICSDKTGTLTQNRMTVVNFYYGLQHRSAYTTADNAFGPEDPDFKAVQRNLTLGTRAVFNPETLDKPVLERLTLGDATESAMIKFVEPVCPIETYRGMYTKVIDVPFNSKNKYAYSIWEDPKTDTRFLVFKGAPERIMDRCSTILLNGVVTPLTDDIRTQMATANEDCGARGERVIGLSQLELDPVQFPHGYPFSADEENYPLTNLTFVGLCSLIDPPRETVPDAVLRCHTAGIKVVMVTGDHPITAKAIAAQVNIIQSPTREDIARQRGIKPDQVTDEVSAIVIPGTLIPTLTDADWDRVLAHREIVFARTTPQQKLIIVTQFQLRGHIVAVTGDGVNDSPALKKADVGIAMGITGSDVSKEAARIILLDDNFASIINGVEEGRLIFDNLKKAIVYGTEHLVPFFIPFVIYFAVQIPVPLTTILIILIDVGSDLLPGISMAYELAEGDIMKRPPRHPVNDRLVTGQLLGMSYGQLGIIEVIGVLLTYFVVWYDKGFTPAMLANSANAMIDTSVVLYDRWGNPVAVEDRWISQRVAQTASWMSIIVMQSFASLTVKTRRASLFQVGLKNKVLIVALVVAYAIAFLVTYTPGVQTVFGTENLVWWYWLIPAAFGVFIIVYDETRKYFIRTYPGGWVYRLTAW